MDFSQLTPQQWILASLCAFTVGLSKSGFGGVGMLSVALMAAVMRGHERESTGLLLPLLICGDLFAMRAFRQHVQWPLLVRMLPPALLGVCIGYFWIKQLSNAGFKPLIGWIVLGLVVMQILRQLRRGPGASVPHSRWIGWAVGISAGITTMLANAAGPIMAIYFLVMELPKLEFVATTAWFFLIVNLWKTPFSISLGLISHGSLFFNVLLVPVVGIGVASGRFFIHRINQRLFERLLLLLTGLTALHLIFF